MSESDVIGSPCSSILVWAFEVIVSNEQHNPNFALIEI